MRQFEDYCEEIRSTRDKENSPVMVNKRLVRKTNTSRRFPSARQRRLKKINW